MPGPGFQSRLWLSWWQYGLLHSGGSITVQPGCRTHAEPLSPALSSPLCLHIVHTALHCTALHCSRWVHFWWDDSNGLVAHSAEGQKRPQAAACTMGRAITHCTLLHTAHVGHCTHYTLVCTAHAAFQTTLKAQMTHNTVHSAQCAHQSVRCTQHCVCELPTHKAHIAYGAEHTHCTLNNTNSTMLL